MYKKASQNLQYRAVAGVVNSRANLGGVDESTFQLDQLEKKRLELVEKKKDFEIKLNKLSLQIKIAKDRHFRNRSDQVDFVVYERMEQQRANLISLVRDIDKRLTEIKQQRLVLEPVRRDHLGETFRMVAEEMLAEPVYRRIMVATLNRMNIADEGAAR
jgi:hypothetical protein